jgi:hypothetical protein
VDKNGLGFEQSFDDVVRNAAGNVKHAVDGFTEQR